MASRDGQVRLAVAARVADDVMAGSVFGGVEEASNFFRCAPLGYAATRRSEVFDGVALGTCGWGMQPLQVEEVRSSFFDDGRRFPPGTAVLDSAFLMEGMDTTWTAQPPLLAGAVR